MSTLPHVSGRKVVQALISAHPRFHLGHWWVSDPKMRNFSQVQGNQGITRRRTRVRRTSDSAPTCHVFSVIDAEIAEKGHLWTETN